MTAPKKPKRSLEQQKADLEKRILDRDCADICDRAILALREAKAAKNWLHARKIGDDLGVAICERAGEAETDYAAMMDNEPRDGDPELAEDADG